MLNRKHIQKLDKENFLAQNKENYSRKNFLKVLFDLKIKII